jgi:predicted amidohydrolase
MQLRIATCQFPVDGNIARNLAYVLAQMRRAKKLGAHVAHFSETCLSGYAGVEFNSFDGFDWDELERATLRVMELAGSLKLWVLLGSSHRLSRGHKPHNSLYVIDDRGRLAGRYDKLFCTGDKTERTDDLMHYSPGSELCTFTIRGVRCGALICHDFRYPELYREYKRRGVVVVFHSFHNAHARPAVVRRAKNIWGVIVPPTMQAHAANNHLWISVNNSSRRTCCWPSFFVRPDGVITGRLPLHRAGVLISTVNPGDKIYDASGAWRGRAMRGVLHSGTAVNDPRSTRRRGL